MREECKTIPEDESCVNCPVNNGKDKEELCDSCFAKKMEKRKVRQEMKEKFGI